MDYIIPIFFILIGLAVFFTAMSFVVHEIGRAYRNRVKVESKKKTQGTDHAGISMEVQKLAGKIND